MKKKILIITGCYLPGFKGGGPIQSIKNLIDILFDYYDFYVITNDRDLGDLEPYKNIKRNIWNDFGKEKVYYLNDKNKTFNTMIEIINKNNFDYIYLNSFFSYRFSIFFILLRKIGLLSKKKIVLAPRGEFSSGAINLKKLKKKIFIVISIILNLYKNITWHATTNEEKELIEKYLGKESLIKIAENVCLFNTNLRPESLEKKKNIGSVRFIFLSRIHPKKNLLFAIEMLKKIKGNVVFDIYGPIEDKKYWEQCKKNIDNLPASIIVTYKGFLKHDEIFNIFLQYHFFFFPTLGENFGHVIAESLSAGCPVILSDQTPWKGLEAKQIGWDINLNDMNSFNNVINVCIEMDDERYKILSKNSCNYIKNFLDTTDYKLKYLELFN